MRMMPSSPPPAAPPVNIAVVALETGLGKDTLRVWERRYGFPQPLRDAQGDRLYPWEQIERLRLIKRLIDAGHRPGRIVTASEAELKALAATLTDTPASAREAPAEIRALRRGDLDGLRRLLSQRLARSGLERFVRDELPPLNAAVGEAWANGELAVHEEHLYTEQVKTLLRQALATLPAGERPRVLLSTAPGELHVLGLLMVETWLALRGAKAISLGGQTPLAEIVAAAELHEADIVALSFSAAYPSRQLKQMVRQLRERLPATVQLWIGGAGCLAYDGAIAGVEHLQSLTDIDERLAQWHAGPAATIPAA